jgi:hypothetical protein
VAIVTLLEALEDLAAERPEAPEEKGPGSLIRVVTIQILPPMAKIMEAREAEGMALAGPQEQAQVVIAK